MRLVISLLFLFFAVVICQHGHQQRVHGHQQHGVQAKSGTRVVKKITPVGQPQQKKQTRVVKKITPVAKPPVKKQTRVVKTIRRYKVGRRVCKMKKINPQWRKKTVARRIHKGRKCTHIKKIQLPDFKRVCSKRTKRITIKLPAGKHGNEAEVRFGRWKLPKVERELPVVSFGDVDKFNPDTWTIYIMPVAADDDNFMLPIVIIRPEDMDISEQFGDDILKLIMINQPDMADLDQWPDFKTVKTPLEDIFGPIEVIDMTKPPKPNTLEVEEPTPNKPSRFPFDLVEFRRRIKEKRPRKVKNLDGKDVDTIFINQDLTQRPGKPMVIIFIGNDPEQFNPDTYLFYTVIVQIRSGAKPPVGIVCPPDFDPYTLSFLNIADNIDNDPDMITIKIIDLNRPEDKTITFTALGTKEKFLEVDYCREFKGDVAGRSMPISSWNVDWDTVRQTMATSASAEISNPAGNRKTIVLGFLTHPCLQVEIPVGFIDGAANVQPDTGRASFKNVKKPSGETTVMALLAAPEINAFEYDLSPAVSLLYDGQVETQGVINYDGVNRLTNFGMSLDELKATFQETASTTNGPNALDISVAYTSLGDNQSQILTGLVGDVNSLDLNTYQLTFVNLEKPDGSEMKFALIADPSISITSDIDFTALAEFLSTISTQ